MNALFRDNANFNEKVFTIAFLTMTCGAIYGWSHSNFIPKENAIIGSIPIAFSYAIFSIYQIATDLNIISALREISYFRKCLLVLMTTILLFFICIVTTSFTLTPIYTNLFGNIFETDAVVVEIKSGFNKGCYSTIVTSFSWKRICTSEKFNSFIKVGQPVKLYGMESNFGYKINNFSSGS